ncbi:hypothetical protein K227x_61650 [Rubripirellula lacrimiformis]|uniref:CinA C-terminal domain-containing protein n=1 Tax=Rubripirellula lacrimiformis TaxID=1930273 RepID=A0A517NKR7_9BACT|nr:hypothetical protein [Rubripirellula lacrimiformis]QDT07737.1 hypothetical protein K227x_61650 [Rubripirellula lacrimiformis]
MLNSMDDPEAADAVNCLARLVQSDWRIALVVTGGGSGAVTQCFRRPQASVNFVEAVIPYSRKSLEDYLGRPPIAGSASPETATQAAMVAHDRATRLGSGDIQDAVGISLLAVLPTQPRRDDQTHRICVSMQAAGGSANWMTEIDDGSMTRQDAEQMADRMFWTAIEHLLSPSVGSGLS